MPTIQDVAKLARVSPATVSRVLNGSAPVADKTRVRVLEAVERLQFQPDSFARALATRRTGGVGVTVNHFGSPYYGRMLDGIEEVVRGAGMHLMVSSGHAAADAERSAVEFLSRRADALIVQADASDENVLLEWARRGMPVVIFGRCIPELLDRCVYLDNEEGARLATRHLLEAGHEMVAHVAGPLGIPDARARLAGYRLALEEAGLAFEESLVVEADFTEEGGRRALERLLGRARPFSAVFVANDQMTMGVMEACRDAGLAIPEEVSIVGYDDLPYARYVTPRLTTIRQPTYEMGRVAATTALALLRGEVPTEERKFLPELIVRDSVMPPRGG